MATIQGIYVALFGRPADPAGLAYFNAVTNNGADLTAIGDLTATAEYQTRFAGQTNEQVVTSIFQSLFERDPDQAGLDFYLAALANGTMTINSIAIDILNGAKNADLATVNAKIAAANIFTASVDLQVEVDAYQGAQAAAVGRAFIDDVESDDPGTQAEADAAIASLLDPDQGQGPGEQPGGGGAGGGEVSGSPDTPPTLEITSGDFSSVAGSTTTIEFSFSEQVFGFDASDVAVQGGTLSDFARVGADRSSYTATFTSNGSPTATLSVQGDSYEDRAGLDGTQPETLVLLDHVNATNVDSISAGRTFADGTVFNSEVRAGSITTDFIPGTTDTAVLLDTDSNNGRLRLNVQLAPDDRVELGDLSSLEFDYYIDSLDRTDVVPTIRLFIDADGDLATTNDRGELVFEYSYQGLGPTTQDSLQTVDILSDDWNAWQRSGGQNRDTFPNIRPLSDWADANGFTPAGAGALNFNENSVVFGFSVAMGSGNGTGQVYIDDLEVNGVSYNFYE